MAQDTEYSPIPYIYESHGLIARDIYDQAPPFTYVQNLNCYERAENTMSSRYGTQIVNRDPTGVGTSNHFFTSPVTSLAKLNYGSSAYRYAGLSNGNLYRRTGNTQGAYTQISSGLSGNTFQTIITNCYETAQPYLFIYDENISVKDTGTLSAPQLTGIDPPDYTANAVPYSPLLSLIDSFATGNTYTTSNVSSWAWATIETLDVTSGQLVTDFTEFFGIQIAGSSTYNPSTSTASTSVTSTTGEQTNTSSSVSGYSSVAISAGEVVNVTLNVQASVSAAASSSTGIVGGGSINYECSTDSGATWTMCYGWGGSVIEGQTVSLPATNVAVTISPFGNLSYLQFRVVVIAATSPGNSVTTSAQINSATAVISAPGTYGPIINGMLAIFNTNTTLNLPIVSVVSSDLVGSLYQQLTITTNAAHGLSANAEIAIYGSSNDLVDGFYEVIAAPTSTTLTVAYVSSVYLSATGGILQGGAAAPSTCVLTNLYSTPYPSQVSAWGFYQQVAASTSSFPISAWDGTVAANTVGTVGKTVTLDLSQNNQVNDADLIVLTLQVGTPANVSNIRLQFDVDGSGYSTSYYYANIVPAYYQGNIANEVSAYDTTQSQILADTLGLITGQPISSTTAQLQPSNFSTGAGAWITVYIPRGNFLPVGTAGSQGFNWANITGWQVVVSTNTNSGGSSIALNGLYLQWGYGPSSFAGTGYDYRYTYYNSATGTESSPSPIQSFNATYGNLSSLAAPFFLRQAAQVTGQYSADSQVTQLRMYRRGGTRADNWLQIDQVPNITAGGGFIYKDVVADAILAQADILVLDNDPPVTSSLIVPIITTLSSATSNPSQTIYSTYVPQTITVSNGSAVFVQNQTVLIGNAYNLEEVLVTVGGTGQFNAILRLQHNAGEQIQVNSIPRQPPQVCAWAYDRAYVVDPVNPSRIFFSKVGMPENFGPEDYIPTSSPDDEVMALINWRGTLIAGTLKTWYIIANGATVPQPTGAVHGIVAQNGWTEVEGAIIYRSADGLRRFTGADGVYMTLPVEWVYQNNPLCLAPQALLADISEDILCFYNNQVFDSFISTAAGNPRYRMIFDLRYNRFRYDDVQATAMLWEKDTNELIIGKQISSGNYAVCIDQVNDYDDGGWVSGALVQTPISMTIQSPYRDLGKPHFPKQWNMLETDVNTNNMTMQTTILFEDGTISLALANQNTGTTRQKVHFTITDSSGVPGDGQQAYRASILHQFSVTAAPILYQEDIYAALLADYNSTYDTYWLKFGIDESKFVKEGYFDYTSTVSISASLYADSSNTPYWTFTLPAQSQRNVIRVRFGNVNPGTTAFTMRQWRCIMLSSNAASPFQLWKKPRVLWKQVGANHSFQIAELEV